MYFPNKFIKRGEQYPRNVPDYINLWEDLSDKLLKLK